MKLLGLILGLLITVPLYAQTINVEMKLGEVNPDATQARFFKGEPAYGLSDAFASVTCWGKEGNSFHLEIEKGGKEYDAQFGSTQECKDLIKKAKGFLGMNYGTIRFILNTKSKKLLSFERI